MKSCLFLLMLMFPIMATAQSKRSMLKLKDGTEIKGVIKAIDPTDAVTITIGGIDTKIKMSTIASIEDLDDVSTTKEQVERKMVIAEDPLKDFKGFLLAKGNNVYVYYSHSDGNENVRYDKEAAKVIKDNLKADGFWNVVDNMNEAHFTINYCVNTFWRDKSILTISSWRTGAVQHLKGTTSNESVGENVVIAQHFYEKAIKPLQKKIEKGHLSKSWIKDFTVK